MAAPVASRHGTLEAGVHLDAWCASSRQVSSSRAVTQRNSRLEEPARPSPPHCCLLPVQPMGPGIVTVASEHIGTPSSRRRDFERTSTAGSGAYCFLQEGHEQPPVPSICIYRAVTGKPSDQRRRAAGVANLSQREDRPRAWQQFTFGHLSRLGNTRTSRPYHSDVDTTRLRLLLRGIVVDQTPLQCLATGVDGASGVTRTAAAPFRPTFTLQLLGGTFANDNGARTRQTATGSCVASASRRQNRRRRFPQCRATFSQA